jgi:hypothetical protein
MVGLLVVALLALALPSLSTIGAMGARPPPPRPLGKGPGYNNVEKTSIPRPPTLNAMPEMPNGITDLQVKFNLVVNCDAYCNVACALHVAPHHSFLPFFLRSFLACALHVAPHHSFLHFFLRSFLACALHVARCTTPFLSSFFPSQGWTWRQHLAI